jgi:hypothetical protein
VQTYQITLIRRVIHLLEGDWVCMTYFCCLKNLSLSKKILALRTGFAPQRKTFVFGFCSVGFQFCSISFHCSRLLSVCHVGFHLPCPSALFAFISALLAFIVTFCSQFALSAFICPVRPLCRRLFLPNWLFIGLLCS